MNEIESELWETMLSWSVVCGEARWLAFDDQCRLQRSVEDRAAYREADCRLVVPYSVRMPGICAIAHHEPSGALESASAGRSLPKSKGKPRRVPWPWDEIGITKAEFFERMEALCA